MAVLEKVPTKLATYGGKNAETIRLAHLHLADIEMPSYQRDRKQAHINKIKDAFDLTAYAFPAVALFNDHQICLDGQQRLAALELLGKEECVVLLYEGITSSQRLAEIFLLINRDRKLLNAFEKHVGALGMNDRGSLDIRKILAEFDLEVSKSASGNGHVPAGAITSIYNSGGREILTRVVRVRTLAWGGLGAREANEGKTLLGLAQFIARYTNPEQPDRVDDDRLIGILKKRHPGFILGYVSKSKEVITYSDYLRTEYNRGLRGKGRL